MAETWTVTMPKLGETVTEGVVGNWLKQVGDTVAFDDPLFEVSTDKVDSEIPSPYDGVILEILVQAGETVPVGAPLVRIGEPGSTPGSADGGPSPAAGGPALSDPAAPATGGSEAMPATAAPGDSAPAGEVHDITMPKLGETVTEGTVGNWLKAVGDTVAFDDPLFEVSTDKVDSEIPSPYDGVLLEILVPEGETVAVGTPLARIGTPGTAAAAAPAPSAAPAAPSAAPATPTGAAPAPARSGNGAAGRVLSPVVRRLAAEHDIDVATLTGTGAGGRVMREDVLAAVGTRPAATPTSAAPAPRTATPAQPAPAPTAAPAPAAPATTAPAPLRAGDREEIVPLSRIRQTIAERMVESRRTAAHVWTSIEVDLERIEQLRQKHKAKFRQQEGGSLTYLPFMARAICDALRAYPVLNSSLDMERKVQIFHHYVNLGIAVDVPGLGLMAPVIKDADALNLRGLARAIRDVGTRGRDRKLTSAELSGSTFTISNPG